MRGKNGKKKQVRCSCKKLEKMFQRFSHLILFTIGILSKKTFLRRQRSRFVRMCFKVTMAHSLLMARQVPVRRTQSLEY